MKKIFMVYLAFSLLIGMSAVTVQAATNEIVPMAANYRMANATISIENGKANVSARMEGIQGVTTKITVHLYLQQYYNGAWRDYDDWFKSNEGSSCTVSKTVAVPAGYKYRAKASFCAYAESRSECITKYSKSTDII